MALIRLHICAGWSEPLLIAHTTLLEILCPGSIVLIYHSTYTSILGYSCKLLTQGMPMLIINEHSLDVSITIVKHFYLAIP